MHHLGTVAVDIAMTSAQARLEGKATALRGAVESGRQGQIDDGKLGMWWDSDSGAASR